MSVSVLSIEREFFLQNVCPSVLTELLKLIWRSRNVFEINLSIISCDARNGDAEMRESNDQKAREIYCTLSGSRGLEKKKIFLLKLVSEECNR